MTQKTLIFELFIKENLLLRYLYLINIYVH